MGGDMLVKDQMTPDPVYGHPDMSVIEAQQRMQQNDIRHLPILDDNKKLVGLITMRSLMRAVPSDVSKFSPFVVNYVLAKVKARNVMVKDVVTISQDTPFEEAARIMADRKIGCLPVMRDDELVGIISDNDLFNTMVNLLGARRGGVRVTVLQPDRAGEVARLSNAIAGKGGYLSVFVTYPTENPDIWASVAKVTNLSEETLVETLSSLPDIRIQDVRQV
jgi:acetoin utilization protein AcuB